MNACQSYRRSDRVCADGFVQVVFCHGGAGCPTCGAVSDAVLPACLRDEVPEHLARPDGSPLFYRQPKEDDR